MFRKIVQALLQGFVIYSVLINIVVPIGVVKADSDSTPYKKESEKENISETDDKSTIQSSLVISTTYYADDIRTTLIDTASANILSVQDASGFSSGDEVLVISMTGVNAGVYETAFITQTLPGQLQLTSNLEKTFSPSDGIVLVQKIPNLGDVTITLTGIITAHAWDGQTGGVIFLRASNITIEEGGRIDANGLGYRGGAVAIDNSSNPSSGEGPGGGQSGINFYFDGTGGGGGSYGSIGYQGHKGSSSQGGWNVAGAVAGGVYGESNLNNLYMGAGGGGGGRNTSNSKPGTAGQSGGGVIYLDVQNNLVVNGKILSNGNSAIAKSSCQNWDDGSGGAGSGGSVYLSAEEILIETGAIVSALGGDGNSNPNANCLYGGKGGNGRIRFRL